MNKPLKLENQLSNLELSKKLKELGVKQESLWKWVKRYGGWKIEATHGSSVFINQGEVNYETVSAFTVAELGEMIKEHPQPEYCLDAKKWVWFATISNDDIDAKTEANIRAKVKIYLKENK